MFERFSQTARRAVFFARYEASQSGSNMIGPEHMLLGILRDGPALQPEVAREIRSAIRERAENLMPRPESISTSFDLPVSPALQRVFARAFEEADGLHSRTVDPCHLLLAVLRSEGSLASELLAEEDLRYDTYRERVLTAAPSEPEPAPPSALSSFVGVVEVPIRKLKRLIDVMAGQLRMDEIYAGTILGRRNWSRKQALGHLVDWACALQQWMAWARSERNMQLPGYPPEASEKSRHYVTYPWRNLVDLWAGLNHLLFHAISQIPEDELGTPCRVGIAKPIPLSQLIAIYVEHVEDVAGEILTRSS